MDEDLVQSPKFDFVVRDLVAVFNRRKLKQDWAKRVKAQIRRQALMDLAEYRDYDSVVNRMIDGIISDVSKGTYQVSPSKQFLVEKSKGLCRQMTLIHPRDLLVLERLSRSMYFELTKKAPSPHAYFEPDNGDFRRGLKRLEAEYGSTFASWKRFQNAIFGFTNENRFIVVTDVANFYDFINFTQLRSIISSLAKVREVVLDFLLYLLNRLSWLPDFMPLSNIGMPQIEATAPRVLVNAMLYEVDKVCRAASPNNYARFMDDIDLGVNSISAAKNAVKRIDLTLQSRQPRLNASKTRIFTQQEAYEHFRIKENQILERYERLTEHFRYRPVILSQLGDGVLSQYSNWLNATATGGPGERSRFVQGNGSKIHKWALRLIYQSGKRVDDKELVWLIRNDPTMRSTAFRFLSYSNRPNTIFHEICRIYQAGLFVDDLALINFADYVVHTRFQKTRKLERGIQKLLTRMSSESDVGRHCAILIASKFGSLDDILRLGNRLRKEISADHWLSRALGGCCARFLSDSARLDNFLKLVGAIGDEDAFAIANYHIRLRTDLKLSQSDWLYLKSKNPSYAQTVYYPKVLALLSASKNPALSPIWPSLLSLHPALRADPYFRRMGF